jgi:hypothetical protein
MQTPIDDSDIFTEVSRSARASPKSLLEPLARNPLQGPSSRSGNSVDSPGPSPRASGSPVCLPASLSQTAPRRLHYQAFGRTVVSLVPFGTQWRPYHKHGWCGHFPTVDWPLASSTDRTLSRVWSLVIGRVLSHWSHSGTSLELIGRCS